MKILSDLLQSKKMGLDSVLEKHEADKCHSSHLPSVLVVVLLGHFARNLTIIDIA